MIKDILVKALSVLSEKKPFFYSEADFQFSLAWQLQQLHPKLHCHLEYPTKLTPESPESNYVDLVIEYEGEYFPIELKYRTRYLEAKIGKMPPYHLKNQSANDITRYDVLKDLRNIELLVNSVDFKEGYVIFITNDYLYWQPSNYTVANDFQFHLHQDKIFKGQLSWHPKTGIGTKKNREINFEFTKPYNCHWVDYSDSIDNIKNSLFRYLLIEVTKNN